MAAGWKGDVLSVKLTAPPVDGAANRACVEFVAGLLGTKKGSVTLVSGVSAREKVLRIEGMSGEEVRRRINSGV